MQYFIPLLWCVFYLLNAVIIRKDLHFKKIYNKLLLLLGVISVLFFILIGLSPLNVLVNILALLTIGFVLYYFGFWSAGDAKYVLILSLFIGENNFVTFLGNIGIITILYIFFSVGVSIIGGDKIGGYPRHVILKKISKRCKKNFITPCKNFIKNPDVHGWIFIIQNINTFFAVFVLVRLSRVYIINELLPSIGIDTNSISKIQIILGTVVFILLTMFIVKKLWLYIAIMLFEKKQIQKETMDVSGMVLLFSFTSLFIIKEYLVSPENLIENMYKIFTIYISIYILVRIFIFLFKVVFIDLEKRSMHIKDLRVGDIIDEDFKQDILFPALSKTPKSKISLKNRNVIQNIKSTVDFQEVEILKNIYTRLKISDGITVINTFAFSPFIFGGFVITHMYGTYIIISIIQIVSSFI